MKDLTRRKFLKNVAMASPALFVSTAVPKSLTVLTKGRALGANDRINIGIIGCGDRGNKVFMDGVYKHAKEMNVEITAICDPWRVAREEANVKVKNGLAEMRGRWFRTKNCLTWIIWMP